MRQIAGGLVLIVGAAACGSEGSGFDAAPSSTGRPDAALVDAAQAEGPDASNAIADGGSTGDALAPTCPSNGTWSSLVPGPNQNGFDAALAMKAARYDRLHEALITKDTGLAGTIGVTSDAAMRQKLDALLGGTWNANDDDPTDDLMQYEGVDPFAFVTSWGMATGMYAGSELAADAFRYGVLRDRGASCNDVARARKMLLIGLDALHVVVDITGIPGGIARSIARKDLPGDGAAPVTPLFDGNNQPLPAEKNNGTWRADNSQGGKYPNLIWLDSCSRDMLFGWTFAMAAAWEVIENDPTFDAATKTRLQADAKSVLDGLRVVRPSGKDLEVWDPDNRRTYHGNLHETSIDRNYVLKNGVASLMALGEVAALVSVVGDASAKGYLQSLTTSRGLPAAVGQSLAVAALGGDKSNHSAFNMLFMTAFMAERYVDDANVRQQLKAPVEGALYNPLFGEKPVEWKQSFFDFVVAASSGDAWRGAPASASYDKGAMDRGLATLSGFPNAPYYPASVENCDAAEINLGKCVLNDGTTLVDVSVAGGEIVADRALPMALRPPSNFFWRTNPKLVNGVGGTTQIFPGSDFRMAYWLGRYVRVN